MICPSCHGHPYAGGLICQHCGGVGIVHCCEGERAQPDATAHHVSRIGDLIVFGDFPSRLVKALGVIADALHPAFDCQSWTRPGWSKRSCVLASLTCRDFLRALGYDDAKAYACALVMRGVDAAGRELHSLGIGDLPGQPQPPDGFWIGHMVVVVPSARLMLDTTLYTAMRPHWPMLSGMIATTMGTPARSITTFGKHPFAAAELFDPASGHYLGIIWLDDHHNKTWRRGPDAVENWRRSAALATLQERFEGQ